MQGRIVLIFFLVPQYAKPHEKQGLKVSVLSRTVWSVTRQPSPGVGWETTEIAIALEMYRDNYKQDAT